MIEFIPLEYYSAVYYVALVCICLITSVTYIGSNDCSKLLRQNSALIPFFFSIVLTLYVGLRPISAKYFCDMGMYAHGYRMCDVNSFSGFFNFHSEWFFEFVMKTCKTLIGDINIWFLVVEIFYFGCQFWACKRLLHENVWMTVLFVFFSYQFFTFGTNGLRNGMACSIMMLAVSFFCQRNTLNYVWGIFLFLLAMGCHRSVMISMVAIIGSLFFVKRIKHAVLIWILCILFSLVSGSFFVNLFSSLGFDDRMIMYSESSATQFSHSGFRWDFLLYSAMPVWLAWYVDRRGIQDKTFSLLANTYILANAMWVLICRIPFSNRFAYLSWYLYALVIAYAVIRVPIWKDQDKKAGWILFAHSFFTIFMFMIGK